jgi:hypothetical protein
MRREWQMSLPLTRALCIRCWSHDDDLHKLSVTVCYTQQWAAGFVRTNDVSSQGRVKELRLLDSRSIDSVLCSGKDYNSSGTGALARKLLNRLYTRRWGHEFVGSILL